ncbi:MAG TPA: M48 family peptidase [Clostridiales bacterium]|nr:M48 family peptidase [Clostridiales bacterium]
MTSIVYYIKRSNRRSISVEITRDLKVLVRSPLKMPDREIREFVEKHSGWILKSIEKQKNAVTMRYDPTEEEIQALINRAMRELPNKVEYYGNIMGCKPGRITITSAKTRFGSCSAQNNISFSWRLMLYPEAAIDYVVVHELAHIKHKNHGKDFYAFIESVLPDYKNRKELLKT